MPTGCVAGYLICLYLCPLIMRRLFVMLVLGALCFQCMAQLGIRAWFSLNRAAITEAFCINKEQPELDCRGSCLLRKKLAEHAHQPDAGAMKHQPEFAFFLLPEPPAPAASRWFEPPLFYKLQQARLPQYFPGRPFEPPRA